VKNISIYNFRIAKRDITLDQKLFYLIHPLAFLNKIPTEAAIELNVFLMTVLQN